MIQKTKIEGRVAAILNARELVINVGSDVGVVQGMRFAVLAESPIIVKDPLTGERLGQIDREKVRVEATDVHLKITICRTFRFKHIEGIPSLASFMGLGSSTALPKDIPETLQMEDSSLPPPLPEEESYVKVKDRVIEVTDE